MTLFARGRVQWWEKNGFFIFLLTVGVIFMTLLIVYSHSHDVHVFVPNFINGTLDYPFREVVI